MTFTVNKLAAISGVSVRTLQSYYEIGLFKPSYYVKSGYRLYEEPQLETRGLGKSRQRETLLNSLRTVPAKLSWPGGLCFTEIAIC